MGILKTFKRWLNQRDAYDQIAAMNRYSPYMGRDRTESATMAAYSQLNEIDDAGEPIEDAELDARERSQRQAAIEQERRRRRSQE